MFFDDSLKGLKKELKAAGVNLSYVKVWQKTYDKVRKQHKILEQQYTTAKTNLSEVMKALKDLEQYLILSKDMSGDGKIKRDVSQIAKTLKQYQNSFDQDFLIGKEDKEFHLIFATILSLCNKDLKEKSNRLILQSEVENLMAITREAQERVWPDFREMAFFYLEHKESELLELPHAEKLSFIEKTYKKEFYNPMYQIIEAALGVDRAKNIMEVDLWI